jgi:hypothetical protein
MSEYKHRRIVRYLRNLSRVHIDEIALDLKSTRNAAGWYLRFYGWVAVGGGYFEPGNDGEAVIA